MNSWIRLLLVGASLLALAAGPAPQTETPGGEDVQIRVTQIDESQFPQVKVYVSVTNAAGEPVGIAPERLRLFENGTALQPDEASGQGDTGPLTTLLIVDVSGSMNEAGKLDAAKGAARAYVEQLRPDDQAGLIAFNTEVNYLQPLTTDRQALLQAIDGLKAQQDTAMYNALAEGVRVLSDVEGRKAIILLADGLDNRSVATADTVIEQIGPSGLSISVIGLGDTSQLGVTNAALDEAALKSLADRAGGVYGFADDPEALRLLYERLARTLQSEYTLIYTSPVALRDGINRNLTVRLLDADVEADTVYNPGGVVPEVPRQNSLPVFAVAMGALFLLLVVPLALSRGAAILRGMPRGNGGKPVRRVKLKEESQSATKPRVRMR
jgi:VWFA-related protein